MLKICRDLNALAARLKDPLLLVGRVVLSFIFLNSAYDRLTGGWDSSIQYMEQAGVPTVFLPLVTALELFGGLFLALGFLSRFSALALGVFSVVAGFVFFGDFSNDDDWISFLDNITIAGGMLLVIGVGPGRWSLDEWLKLEGRE
jgi:putative oxidoreductase